MFVQRFSGKVADRGTVRAVLEGRPSGAGRSSRDDGEYIMCVRFTAKAEAREGEAQELPAELAAQMQEMTGLYDGEVPYADLRNPWLASAS